MTLDNRYRTNEFAGTILRASNGLKTKFDTTGIKYKKTFKEAIKLGIDLNNTNKMFKKDCTIWVVSVTQYKFRGRQYESVSVHPFINLLNK